jgi:predicted DNA-binding protein
MSYTIDLPISIQDSDFPEGLKRLARSYPEIFNYQTPYMRAVQIKNEALLKLDKEMKFRLDANEKALAMVSAEYRAKAVERYIQISKNNSEWEVEQRLAIDDTFHTNLDKFQQRDTTIIKTQAKLIKRYYYDFIELLSDTSFTFLQSKYDWFVKREEDIYKEMYRLEINAEARRRLKIGDSATLNALQ